MSFKLKGGFTPSREAGEIGCAEPKIGKARLKFESLTTSANVALPSLN